MLNRYIEFADGSPKNRGLLIPIRDYHTHVYEEGAKKALYRSVYIYDQSGYEAIRKKGTVKNYFGIRDIDVVPIDIDKENNTDKFTLQKLQALLYELCEEGLSKENCQIYFSGTGYHVDIHKDCFGFVPSEDLPYIIKETMRLISKNIDLSIYIRSGIYRCEHSLNLKSGLYKVPLSWQEVNSLSSTEIKKLAQKRRLDFQYHELYGDGELSGYLIRKIPKIKVMKQVNEPLTIVPCIQKMYTEGALEGSRNNKILRLASHFKRNGIPSMAAKAAILAWNEESLEEQLVTEKVESVYNSNYKYGCSDFLMKKYCNPRCVHFKRKDYLIDVKNADQLQKDLEDRLTMNWHGKTINLSRIFGLPDNIDCTIYPGELVTIFGPTGSNKTALAQCIAMGLDMEKNIIDESLQIPTLYLSLELSGWTMHRRNLQIASGEDKDSIKDNFKQIYKNNKKYLDHIMVQTVSPTIDQIRQKIKELQPHCVVVDYIDLIESERKDEYGHIKYVSHALRGLAVNLDTIIIQLSQISREYSRKQILDLYAGKGSGGIENASSKVIGITGKAKEITRKIELFKNTDGDLFETDLIWTPSFRLIHPME